MDTAIFNSQVNDLTQSALSARKIGQLEALKGNLSETDLREINHVAQEFESVFLSQMMKPMFQELETEGQFGGGHAEEIWRGIMIDEMAKEFAASGGVGIADIVRKELIEMQGRQIPAPSSQVNANTPQANKAAAAVYDTTLNTGNGDISHDE